MAQFSEQDHILLNSYIDGQLEATERADFEARLAADFALRIELEQLQQTIGLLKMAERVPVPRSFTLNPATYGKPARRSFWDNFGLTSVPGWAVATASLVVVMLCVGALIVNGGLGGTPTSVAEAPALMMRAATEAAPEMAALATEAPAPTEAPAAAAPPTEAPTEAALYAATGPSGATSAKSAPVAPPGTGDMTASGMGGGPPAGMGGGPAETSGAAGGGPANDAGSQGAAPMPLPTLAAGAMAQMAPTEIAPGSQDTQANSASNPADSARGLAGAPTPAPYATIEVKEAQPWDHLEPGSWAILLGGTGLLIALVLGVTFLMRRRR